MSARDEAVEMIRRICPPHLSADEYGQILAEKFDEHRTEVRAEVLGSDLNPSNLVLDAQAYRQLADAITATMTDPERWDGDDDEGTILARYVEWLAHEREAALSEALPQQAAATEYRVPSPDGPGLYVRRAPSGDGWAVFEPRGNRGRRAWTRDGWQLLAILAGSEVHCWPDATTALAEARKALAAEAGGSR